VKGRPDQHDIEVGVLLVAGPTGSGKSALAMDAAEAFDGVIINADSMQVYRELRLITARPSPTDEARAPHRLYGFVSAAERCSVGRWLGFARSEIAAAAGAGRLPIIVGGTGLYLRALLEGLAEVPPIPAEIRREAEARHAESGGAAFRHELGRLDPEGAKRIAPGDRQRLIRAFEVARWTGQPLSEWQRRCSTPGVRDGTGRFATIALLPSRENLYPALEARLESMLAKGAVDEVGALLALDLDPDLPAMKAVGVREIGAYIRGETTLEQATKLAKQATRRFAKRQYTWLRHQLSAELVADEQYSKRFWSRTFSFIRHRLLTGSA
jgi:tRNA dimethylallyltransferase